jgi:hypothetical protein
MTVSRSPAQPISSVKNGRFLKTEFFDRARGFQARFGATPLRGWFAPRDFVVVSRGFVQDDVAAPSLKRCAMRHCPSISRGSVRAADGDPFG